MTAISRRSSSKERTLIFSMRSAARRRRFEILAGLAAFFVFPAIAFFLGFDLFIAYYQPSPLPSVAASWRGESSVTPSEWAFHVDENSTEENSAKYAFCLICGYNRQRAGNNKHRCL